MLFRSSKDSVELTCFVYKPTGITKEASGLIKDDLVRVGGGIRRSSIKHGRVLNVEFFEVLRLQKKTILQNPQCTKCNKKMKSKGRNQGFECIKCGKKAIKKINLEIPRQITRQLYIPQPSAHRHLTRPKQRVNVINKPIKFNNLESWFSNYSN